MYRGKLTASIPLYIRLYILDVNWYYDQFWKNTQRPCPVQVEEDHTGYIPLDKFLPAMTKVLLEHK